MVPVERKTFLLRKKLMPATGKFTMRADKRRNGRFYGKPVIKVKVSDGIHKSQELIERAVKGDGPIYHHEGEARQQALLPKEMKKLCMLNL